MSVQIAETPVGLEIRPKQVTIGALRNADLLVALQLLSGHWAQEVTGDFFEEARQALPPDFFTRLTHAREELREPFSSAFTVIVWQEGLLEAPVEMLLEPICTASPKLAVEAERLPEAAEYDRDTFILGLAAGYGRELKREQAEKWLAPLWDFLNRPPAQRRQVAELIEEFWDGYFREAYTREIPGLHEEESRAARQLGSAPTLFEIVNALPPRHFIRVQPQHLAEEVRKGLGVRLVPMRFAGGLGVCFKTKTEFVIGYTLPTVKVENVFDQVARTMAGRFKALADPTRLRILKFCSCGEKYTWQVAEFLGIAQPTATEHLRILRESGYVTCRKQGSYVYYSTNHEALKQACGRFLEIIG